MWHFIKCKSVETSLIFKSLFWLFPCSAAHSNFNGCRASGSWRFQRSHGTVFPEKQSSSPHHGTRPPIPSFEPILKLGKKCDRTKWYDMIYDIIWYQMIFWYSDILMIRVLWYYHLMNDWSISHTTGVSFSLQKPPWTIEMWNVYLAFRSNHKKALRDLSKFAAWIWLETWLSKSLILSIRCSGWLLVGAWSIKMEIRGS